MTTIRRFGLFTAAVLAGGILLIGGFIVFLIVSEAPILPDLDDLEPLPDNLHVVDSYAATGHGGGRLPAQVYLIIQMKGPSQDRGAAAQASLEEHLRSGGWNRTERRDWGFSSTRPNGPNLVYGLLDDYLKDVEKTGTEMSVGRDVLAFLREHQAPGRLLVVAI